MNTRILVFLFFTLTFPAFSQPEDSLEVLLTQKLEPTKRQEVLIALCESYRDKNTNSMRLYAEELIALSNTDSLTTNFAWGQYYLGDYFYVINQFRKSESHFQLANQIFNQLESTTGILKSASSLANVYFFQDRYQRALNYSNAALELAYQEDEKLKQANLLSLICDIYTRMERYNTAIQYCVQSLNIIEELQIDDGKEITLNTIGIIYQELGTYEKSKKYLFDALELAKNNEIPYNIATTYSNIGNYYLEIGYVDSALSSFRKAIYLDSASDNKIGLAYSFFDIGKIYKNKGIIDSALLFFNYGQDLSKDQQMPELKARIGLELGDLFLQEKNYKEAIEILKTSSTIAQQINSSTLLKESYRLLARLYDTMGDQSNALVYMKLFMLESERKFKEENIEKIAEIEAIYNLEQKEKEIELLQRDNDIRALEDKQKSFVIMALGSGFILLAILILILYNRNKLKNKTNEILNAQNQAISEQKEEIEAQKEELTDKGNTLAYKNQQITDSIKYTKQIQDSLLPQSQTINQVLPDSFVFMKPKDIVSGDFYWFTPIAGKVALALVDCTGHGVPGAFMTILANSLLNQIVIETGITSPDLVVSLLDQKIQQSLHQSNLENSNTDGLDIALLLIDQKKKTIEYTGAKIPLYLYQNEDIELIEPNRVSVGSAHEEEKVFSKRQIPYSKGSMVYLTSDGYQDQFGGKNNKKFMKKNFRKLLKEIGDLSIEEQSDRIEESFLHWRGSQAQTDDILVIGFKLK